jgi:hypothetical protein
MAGQVGHDISRRGGSPQHGHLRMQHQGLDVLGRIGTSEQREQIMPVWRRVVALPGR